MLAAVIYLPGLPGAFVFDDLGSIANNAGLHTAKLDLDHILAAIFSAPVGGLLRPLSTLSFMLDAHFFGVSPEPFKLTNICIHVATGALLWFLARELLWAARSSGSLQAGDREIAWLSLTVSTLWLVHPLNLTSVLYVVQRDNALSAFFTAAAVSAYLAGRRRMREGTAGHWQLWLWTPLLTVVGTLCKENAALTPVYILVIEFTLLGFRGADGRPSREVRRFFMAFLLVPALGACLLMARRPEIFFSGYVLRGFTAYERLLSECRVLLDYLYWICAPDLRQLGLFHDDIVPSRGLLEPVTTLFSVVAIAGLLAIAFSTRKRAPLLSFGLLWFFTGHLMESTFLPLELAYEHRNYLPLFGLLLGTTGTLSAWLARRSLAKVGRLLAGVCILLLSLVTAMRASDWQNELTFAKSESRHHPHSPRALAELQWAYVGYIVSSRDTRVIPLALDAAARSRAADRGSINQDVGLAYMYASLADLGQARAYLGDVSVEAARASPTSTLQLALQSLLTMTTEANAPLFADMSRVFSEALRNPALMNEPCYAAGIWNTYGLFRRNIGDVPGALGALHRAVTLCPRDMLMRTNYIHMLLQYGDTEDAAPQLDSLRESHDLRYLPEIRRLQQEYAELLAQRPKK